MDRRDVIILRNLLLSVNDALLYKVIPSLREVILKWQPATEVAWIDFYHDGEINDAIEKHYKSIFTKVQANISTGPKINFNIIRSDYPERIPKEKYVIYVRAEPFVDPK